MATREISVLMESRYKSNLAQELRRDKRKLDAFQSYLDRRPFVLPVKLDLKGAAAQAKEMRKAIMAQLDDVQSQILGADGRPASARARGVGVLGSAAGILSSTEILKRNKYGQLVKSELQTVEQLGRGVQQVNKYKAKGADFDASPYMVSTRRTTQEVEKLRDAMQGMNQDMRKAYSSAVGRQDRDEQIRLLGEQKRRLDQALQEAASNGLGGSRDFQKAEAQVDRLTDKIATLEGRQESAAVRESRKARGRAIDNQIRQEEHRVAQAVKANKMEMDAAERLPDRSRREAEVNRLFQERQKIYQESRNKFRNLDKGMQEEGRPDLADKAMRRTLNMENAANQARLDGQRAETDAMRRAAAEKEKIDKENQKRSEKAKLLADKAAARSSNRNFSRSLRLDEYATRLALTQNDAAMAQAKAIPERAAREAEVNRVLRERSGIYEDQSKRLDRLQKSQAASGNVDNAAKAEVAKLKASENASKVGVSQVKADAAAQMAAEKESERDRKAQKEKARADREAGFRREMQDIKARSDRRIAQINANERRERAAAKSAEARALASQKGHSLRVSEYGNRERAYAGVESRARSAGMVPIADDARGKRLQAGVSAAKDMEKFSASTVRSGHALNFHSAALLRNAVTFAKWMGPVSVVMGTMSALGAGFGGAVEIDRQFATLLAVFRGTREEAQRLKEETLDLAAAQGRSGEEAMDAAIRWSRLGLNRVQVNQAVRTSLMAANVAEIKAAEAAEKLSAIYATYRLKVGDLPVLLSRLNAISNRYNVTNKDLLEGIVRVAGVAQTAGMQLRDLEGIIGAVTGATGRPGQEVGNALKFVITRLAAPETMDGLKSAFDIDLTGPNGDLKDMSQIFRELAQIYPTLNNSQRQYFLKLVAGSRQASRFALVMDQYRQAMILSAEAAFDTNSAYEENQKILESLQSRFESLKASWIDLFDAMGDAGLFDWLGKRLRWVQQVIQDISGGLDESANKVGDITINDPSLAETVERLGGGENLLFGSREKFSREELIETQNKLGDAIQRERNRGFWGNLARTNPFTGNKADITVGTPFSNASYKDLDELIKAKNILDMLLEDGGRSGAQDKISVMTNEVDQLRERLAGLQYGVNIFQSLSDAIGSSSVDRSTMIRDFENGAHLLLNLDGGSKKYADTMREFYDLLERGDNEGISDLADKIRMLFSEDLKISSPALEKAIAPALQALRNELVEVDKAKRALNERVIPEGDAQAAKVHVEQLEELQSQYKMIQQAIEQVTQSSARMNQSAYNFKEVRGINQYVDDLMLNAKLISEAFQDFAPDTENDPVARVFNSRREMLRLGADALQGVAQATAAEAESRRQAARNDIAIAEANFRNNPGAIDQKNFDEQIRIQNRILEQQDDAVEQTKQRIAAELERIRVMERELEISERIAQIQKVSRDAGRSAADSSLAFRFGETDSEKNSNQARFAIQRASRSLLEADLDSVYGDGDRQRTAAFYGQILQDEATARLALQDMTRRQYEIEAERKQVAIDTLKTLREQSEEAAKRLALASREDQLRAAALARAIDRGGPLTQSEFFSLSQESRQVAVNYSPNSVPDFLNEAKVQQVRSYRELDSEKRRLVSSVSDVSRSLQSLSDRISVAVQKGGSLDFVPRPDPKPLQDAADKGARDQTPIVNLNVGDVSVSVDVTRQIEVLLSGYVDRKFSTEIKALERRLRVRQAPSAQPYVE